MLDDPRVNFVIETSADASGLSHLGIQVESAEELSQQYTNVAAAGGKVIDQGETMCCFARSTKNWTADPDGLWWETFFTHERTGQYGKHVKFPDLPNSEERETNPNTGCCD
jgi:hypothetical protein